MAEPAPKMGMTAEEFFAHYAGQRVELVQGEVKAFGSPGSGYRQPPGPDAKAPVGGSHGQRAVRLSGLLDAFVAAHDLGYVANEVGFMLDRDPDVMRAPDVAFIALARFPEGLPDGFIEGAPDLAVEIISPWDKAGDIEDKVAEYLAAGTPEVWLVYPSRKQVIIRRETVAHILRVGDDLCGSGLLEGLRIPLTRLFTR